MHSRSLEDLAEVWEVMKELKVVKGRRMEWKYC